MTKAEREEMKALSTQVFGGPNRYKKIMQKGLLETQTHSIMELVPGENGEPDTARETQVPDTVNGRPVRVVRYPTETEMRDMMVKQRDSYLKSVAEYQAKQEAEKQEAEAKKLQNEVHNHLVGSAV
jgi:prophage tail gpP-like protein